MSLVFMVVPAVVVGWPVLCGAVAAAAAGLGYTTLKLGQSTDIDLDCARSSRTCVEIPLQDSQIIADTMARESEFTIHKDDVTATFSRGADGQVSVHISGDNKLESELDAVGQELIGRVTQQYSYNKVLTELKAQGFSVTSEEVANDQTIRIHVSKYV